MSQSQTEAEFLNAWSESASRRVQDQRVGDRRMPDLFAGPLPDEDEAA